MAKYNDDAFRRSDDVTIKQAVEKLLDVYRLRRKFDETSIVTAWPELIGSAIANRTQQIYIRDKKLFVRVESAVIKNELAMMRRQIIGRVNEYVGKVVIEEFVIL
ncbi:hypothetical protein SMI01S_31000 [Sphingobacterium mizutaii NBRC 14946 = DSM 11724]|uniref:Zn-ribbon-containing, possibly RNA-binding protein and truncated derivatives n=2 Tax=Sphingobacterium mizutaii TaxID=1010 RepID=A0AAJ4XAA4_9SPHI|nr:MULTISPECIES: DUF721 domain-containing protein [Sphingobacterium]MBV2227813.1 DUF721 domain-containing protein [Sphingobacterium mizutaii]GEM69494.1 hypothetical protein SMI01S_31000 [Sphingobacterium mizutaii NBRC 14946 = DSM 11724]SDL88899.1 Protein of unknown function [Sphingobacterium mizutaii]SNV42117.1 Zn-ribbon-containing, possibly RNA-binding protein and truncated derivatives [Sphingobacterium mizutaii]